MRTRGLFLRSILLYPSLNGMLCFWNVLLISETCSSGVKVRVENMLCISRAMGVVFRKDRELQVYFGPHFGKGGKGNHSTGRSICCDFVIL